MYSFVPACLAREVGQSVSHYTTPSTEHRAPVARYHTRERTVTRDGLGVTERKVLYVVFVPTISLSI